jgi:hypothetical protein
MNSGDEFDLPRETDWRDITTKVLGVAQAGQELLIMAQSDEDHAKYLESLFQELEAMCWEQFRKKRDTLIQAEIKKAELADLDKEYDICMQKTNDFGNKMLKDLDLMAHKEFSDDSLDQLPESRGTGEGDEARRSVGFEPRKPLGSGAVSTKSNSMKTIRFLEDKIHDCIFTLIRTRDQSKSQIRKELILSLRVKALTFKLENLDTVEKLRGSQLAQVRAETEKVRFVLLRKERNLHTLRSLCHEAEVD